MPRRGERAGARQERQALGDEGQPHPAPVRHLVAVPEEPEAGDVGAGVHLEAPEHARGRGVERRHALDRGRVLGRAPRAALERRRDDPRAERLGQDERIAGPRPYVAQDAVRMHQSGHRHAELDLLVDDGVTADDHHARLLRLGEAAAQDVGQDLQGDAALREARDVERRLRLAPHGVDIGEGVGGRDRAELEGVVDDGREEVHRLHERQVGRDAEHPGVVGGRGADQQIRVHHRRERAEDLRQVRRTQLAGSTRRARPRRQPEELRPRARAALAFGHERTVAGASQRVQGDAWPRDRGLGTAAHPPRSRAAGQRRSLRTSPTRRVTPVRSHQSRKAIANLRLAPIRSRKTAAVISPCARQCASTIAFASPAAARA